ncbi:hypothetical protein L5515_001715 [Caenorhabditis briggsae]|uniref:Uncharacterized protein n=1 Tax=Caenorhabditis briggsae TaxID=6238 RepID=A0AAE9E6M2_CAEBR|nr:hypothetical protein L3Y34_015637 [Caenorhabditis briggsae]UMM13450.1 hypothetical protein L5515_001715 [Caenorhabditis briggsae]
MELKDATPPLFIPPDTSKTSLTKFPRILTTSVLSTRTIRSSRSSFSIQHSRPSRRKQLSRPFPRSWDFPKKLETSSDFWPRTDVLTSLSLLFLLSNPSCALTAESFLFRLHLLKN